MLITNECKETVTTPKKVTTVYSHKDSAGNVYYSEYEVGSSAPIRTWIECGSIWTSGPLPSYHSER